MSLTIEQCNLCKGRPMERLEELSLNGEWVHNAQLDTALADAWIKSDPNAPLRWADAKCPRCDGAGEYPIEHVFCKIF